MYIPLEFWFCQTPACSAPDRLQYHEVKINFEFTDISDLMVYEAPTFARWQHGATLFVDYVYLDTDERRRLQQ
jgi:hypothetical protein